MSVQRPDLETRLHALSNFIECQLASLLPELLIGGNTTQVRDLVYNGCGLIETLRELRDGREGGAA